MKAGIFCIAKISAFLFSYEEVLKKRSVVCKHRRQPLFVCRDKFRHKKITSNEMILWFDFQNCTGKGVGNVFEKVFV